MTLPDPPRTKGRPRTAPREARTIKQTLDTWEAFDALPGANTAERFRNLLLTASGRIKKPKIILMTDGTWEQVKKSQ